MPGFAQDERHGLADLMLEVGPDAPTLCEGWTTRDLAAHLVLRSHRPDAAAGIVIRPLAPYTERVQRDIRDGRTWPGLVEVMRKGPPPVLRSLMESVDAVEYFVHHEDVRRATPGWEPRDLDPALERMLWRRSKAMGMLAGLRLPVGLTLESHGYGRSAVRRREPRVTLTGAPGELVLFLNGRQQAARVDVSGPPEAVAALHGARLGI